MNDQIKAEKAHEHTPPLWPVNAYLRDDGTGYFYACPVCHFWKNTAPGPCRLIGCEGTVEQVEFVTSSPGTPSADG